MVESQEPRQILALRSVTPLLIAAIVGKKGVSPPGHTHTRYAVVSTNGKLQTQRGLPVALHCGYGGFVHGTHIASVKRADRKDLACPVSVEGRHDR